MFQNEKLTIFGWLIFTSVMPREQCEICGCWENSAKGLANHCRAFHEHKDDNGNKIDLHVSMNDHNNMSFENCSVINEEEFSVGRNENFDIEYEISDASDADTSVVDKTFGNNENEESDSEENQSKLLNASTILDLHEEKICRDAMFIPDFRLDVSVELMEILRKAKAPLYLYKEIFQWAKKCSEQQPDFFLQQAYTREKVILDVQHKFNIDLHPKNHEIVLPSKKKLILLLTISKTVYIRFYRTKIS